MKLRTAWIRLRQPALLAAFALAPLALPARAQGVSLTLGKFGKHASVALTLGGRGCGLERPRYEAPKVWIDGRYETRIERVWVPECERKEWVPACYAWRTNACGVRFQVLVSQGYWRTVVTPGHYEEREVQVWVPGHWRAARY